jgi:hypothetical protein
MGWLGWTPDVCLAADVNIIQIAIEGRIEMLGQIFGSGKSEKPQPITAASWKAMVGNHNMRYQAKKAKIGGGDG